MKNSILLVISCFCLFPIPNTSCSRDTTENPEKENELIIMTYNVHQCVGVDNKKDYQRVANIIIRINPQVVGLQELDSATQRSNGIIVLNELANRTNRYHVYGPYFDFEGGKYGVGILSKEKPINWKSVPIPGRIENRLLYVELKDFIFCCTHFSLTEEDRLKSVAILNELFKGFSKPVFFAGDLNSEPESETIKNIETKWTMLNNPADFTYPSDNPVKCIDDIFVLKDSIHIFKIEQSVVEKEPVASDHRPVWVKVTATVAEKK